MKVHETLFFAAIYQVAKQHQGKRHFHQKRIHYLDNTRRIPKKKNKGRPFVAEGSWPLAFFENQIITDIYL